MLDCVLDALAEANDQLHWGMKPDEIERAAARLGMFAINPDLLRQLQSKAVLMRALQQHRPDWGRDSSAETVSRA